MNYFVIESYENHQAALCDGAINHIAINVKSIEEAYEWIMQQGLNNTQDDIHFLPFWEKGVKFFTIEGPNKERIEFSQYL
jgi:lactoylglutathione lyase